MKQSVKNGVLAFIFVLLLMPIGHAIMVLIEKGIPNYKFEGAFVLGLLGVILLIWGIKKNKNLTLSSILGFLGAILVWTGWVEFSFVWIAEKNHVLPYMVKGEISTKPEYLVMLSSIGLLGCILLFFLFAKSQCTLFIQIQKFLKIWGVINDQGQVQRPKSLVTFFETIVLIWFFYILLLVIYDEQILGTYHPITYAIAYLSLAWSIFLIYKLLKIKTFDFALRYAIPTVIIFWNFIEILGRWDVFKEIWVHPFDYKIEILLFFITFFVVLGVITYVPSFQRMKKSKL